MIETVGLALGALVCVWTAVAESIHLWAVLFRLGAIGAPAARTVRE